MILGKQAILDAIVTGDIVIDPFDETAVGPNSVNLTLHNELLVYRNEQLDMAEDNPTDRITIPAEGLILQPGRIYLGRTVEWTETLKHVPMIEGRSSTGRLGLDIHISAGFGDRFFRGAWTLELRVVQPLRIYPFVRVAQIHYHEVRGGDTGYAGKYQGARDIQSSRLWQEFRTAKESA